MDDEALITFVEQYDILYNKNNLDFKNPKKKVVIWQSIAAELGITVDQCVKRWTTLRERYSKESRRKNQITENGELYEIRWPYYRTMRFLKPHMTYRANRSSLTTELANLRSNTDPLSIPSRSAKPCQSSLATFEQPLSPLPTFVPKISPASSVASAPCSSPVPSIAASPPHTSEPSTNKRKLNVDKIFSEAIETFKKVRAAREVEIGSPGIRGFGDMIVSILSSMSERKQIKAMKNATEIVMSIKLQSDD